MALADTPGRIAYRQHRRAVGSAVFAERIRRLMPFMVTCWIMSGGVVLIEPSPYELMFLLVLPVAIMGGLTLYRGTLNLAMLLVFFIPFALIAAFQPRHFEPLETFAFQAITIFLWLTAFFAANFIAHDPQKNLRLVMRAYLAIAIIVALVGTLAYLGLLPGKDLFLRYGRAKATFKDPNVFGPFLIPPAIFALQALLLSRGRAALLGAVAYGILFVGVFVSFSRGAWGHLALSSLMVFALVFWLEAKARDKARMLILLLFGILALAAVLAVLLSIDSVRDLFLQRFSITQNYDTGSTGRFGRQLYAIELAIAHPLGLGPREFTALRIVEEPHNTYVSVFLTYGWLGGFAFVSMIGLTVWRGIKRLAIPSPNRLLLIPLMSIYIPLALEAAIIDMDHWRHFFLMTGLVWGVTARYRQPHPTPRLPDVQTRLSPAR